MAAGFVGQVWALEREEARDLADALAAVQAEYGVPISDRHMVLVGLGSVAAAIYGKRVAILMGVKIAPPGGEASPAPAPAAPFVNGASPAQVPEDLPLNGEAWFTPSGDVSTTSH